MMSDSLLRAQGFDYNFAQSAWQYIAPGTTAVTTGNAARDRLQRILAIHIVKTPNDEMADLSGSGIIETYGGEYIKWNNGKLASAGTYSYKVTAGASKIAGNGRVYYSDSLLNYSDTTIGFTIKRLASTPGSQFNFFYQFLSNSTLYNSTTGDIRGVNIGTLYTVFIPSNDAIQTAVDAGYLPADPNDGSPLYITADPVQQQTIANFIRYHILDGTTMIPDGKKPQGGGVGPVNTLYKDGFGNIGQINVTNSLGAITLKDYSNPANTAKVIVAKSNNLANRCVIHLIDNCLQYY